MAHQRRRRWGLTLFLFELVLCQEDGPHQLSHRRLNRHKEFLGVSAEKEEERSRFHSAASFHFLHMRPRRAALFFPNTPTAPCPVQSGAAERLKDGAGLTTAGSLPLAWSRRNRCPAQPWPSRPQAAALSTHSGGEMKEKKGHLVKQQLFELGLNLSSSVSR